MRETVNIGGFGEVILTPPNSFVAINDLISEYGGAQHSRAKLARLSAAAIGICWSDDNDRSAPIYNVASGEIVAYGGEVLEWAMRYRVNLADLYNEARPLFTELWNLLPKEKEVAAKAEYFQDEGQA